MRRRTDETLSSGKRACVCFRPGDARARVRLDARELKHW